MSGEDEQSCGSIDFSKGVKNLVDSVKDLKHLPSEFVLPMQRNITVNHSENIPVIDLAGLNGSVEDRMSIVREIGHACVDWGFFTVKNHGINQIVVKEMLKVVEEFFDLDLEEKKKYSSEDVMNPVRYGTSLNTSRQHNLHWRDYLRHHGHPFRKSVHLWPNNPPNYRNVAKDYLEQVWKLSMTILGLISESLGLDVGHIEKSLGEGIQIIATNYYPPCPEPDKTLGMAAHSDHGALTILTHNGVDGLQIKHNGEWFYVQSVPDTFLVNIGDYLEILSNGRYPSVEHRAIVNPFKTRISMAVGHGPELSTIVKPADSLLNTGETIKYRPVMYKDYMRLQQSITTRGKTSLEPLKMNGGGSDKSVEASTIEA